MPEPIPIPTPPKQPPGRPLRPTVDELGEASFPASDPPPSWIWEPPRTPPGA
ncbi:hypothetical protein [Capillimicrobium parvum]|uniref:Uncharacterized protein n=1 Tax=Capillimicrobium parvum TaxID=2884022 RepID=A0A9E6XU55_9ACTN|nr:hypothetical protein [Capillimicrobium parvum]UGS34494.1 hypothetical protein DSM104329_00872 [Capillimicrobium parvum]